MTKFTKEQLQEIAETDHVQCGDAAAMARQLLAGMGQEQEPVAWEVKGILCHTRAEANVYVGEPEPLYAAPRLPQPAVGQKDVESLATDLMKRIDKITGERHSVATLSSLRVSIVEACRAAMLQGAEPVQGWIPYSERTPPRTPDTSTEYLVYETLNNTVQHDYWNVPEGNKICQAFWNHYSDSVTHWMPLPAAPQQEVK